jgi:hypothetical protein
MIARWVKQLTQSASYRPEAEQLVHVAEVLDAFYEHQPLHPDTRERVTASYSPASADGGPP